VLRLVFFVGRAVRPLTLRCPCFAAVQSVPSHCASMLRSRAGPDIHVRSLATVLLAHALAFADMRLTLPSPGTVS
jgi:hypothetical protein